MIYDKIVESKTEPLAKNVLWLKPVDGGFAFYRHYNGRWVPLKLMDDKGTVNPEDDTPADISNIPAIVTETVEQILPEAIGDSVEEEVKKQMGVHDVQVGDVHYEESQDGTEYPDYSDII